MVQFLYSACILRDGYTGENTMCTCARSEEVNGCVEDY